jgi:hypothetical protein
MGENDFANDQSGRPRRAVAHVEARVELAFEVDRGLSDSDGADFLGRKRVKTDFPKLVNTVRVVS